VGGGLMADWQSRVEEVWHNVESELRRTNAYGHLPLNYRTADYSSSLERMRLSLPAYTVSSPDGLIQPLSQVELKGRPNWLLGLLESWALIAQVLGFYQERMANEGFLASALREISVREMLAMVGYRPFPGTAGSALSAFLLSCLLYTSPSPRD